MEKFAGRKALENTVVHLQVMSEIEHRRNFQLVLGHNWRSMIDGGQGRVYREFSHVDRGVKRACVWRDSSETEDGGRKEEGRAMDDGHKTL